MMRALAVRLVCLIAWLVWIEQSSAQTLNLTRSVESGLDTSIAQERAWHARNCDTIPVKVTITKKPANGAITVVPGVTSTIPSSTPATGNTGACAGKTVTGNEVKYKSNARFRGTDSVSYTVSNQPRQPRIDPDFPLIEMRSNLLQDIRIEVMYCPRHTAGTCIWKLRPLQVQWRRAPARSRA